MENKSLRDRLKIADDRLNKLGYTLITDDGFQYIAIFKKEETSSLDGLVPIILFIDPVNDDDEICLSFSARIDWEFRYRYPITDRYADSHKLQELWGRKLAVCKYLNELNLVGPKHVIVRLLADIQNNRRRRKGC